MTVVAISGLSHIKIVTVAPMLNIGIIVIQFRELQKKTLLKIDEILHCVPCSFYQ